MSVMLSDILRLPEWQTHFATGPQFDVHVANMELILSIPEAFEEAVLYCLPWSASLYDPRLDVAIRRLSRDAAAGLLIARVEETGGLPSHLVNLSQRMHVNTFVANASAVGSLFATATRYLSDAQSQHLREASHALLQISEAARMSPTVEDLLATLHDMGLTASWHTSPTRPDVIGEESADSVWLAGSRIGYLVSEIGEKGRDAFASIISQLTAAVHLANLTRWQAETGDQSRLLVQLLDKTSSVEARVVAARLARFDLAVPLHVFVLVELFRTVEDTHWDRVLSTISRTLITLQHPALIGYYQGYPTVLVQWRRSSGSAGTQNIEGVFETLVPDGMVAGFSTCNTIADAADALFDDAVQAAVMARTLGKREKLARVGSMAQERLLFTLVTSPFAMMLARSVLDPLVQHDASHNTDLVATVSAYVMHGTKMAETAGSLNLHRNSLRYRLTNIEKILGISLDQPETILLLQLAVLTYHAQGSNSFRENA